MEFTADNADFWPMGYHTSIGYRMLDIEAKYPLTDIFVFDDVKDTQGQQKYKIITVGMSVMFCAWLRWNK